MSLIRKPLKRLLRLATAEPNPTIWHHLAPSACSLTSKERPNDEGWTGAEIRECCRKAWRLNLSLKESAEKKRGSAVCSTAMESRQAKYPALE